MLSHSGFRSGASIDPQKKCIGTPRLRDKSRGRTGKRACKSVEHGVNEKSHKKKPTLFAG
jgi:hypothetical protein